MKRRPKYLEGRKAKENFERGMKALFQVPKTVSKKKQQDKPTASPEETGIFRQGLKGDLRFPRPYRLVARQRFVAHYFAVRESLTSGFGSR
jgi:hypothetical protein